MKRDKAFPKIPFFVDIIKTTFTGLPRTLNSPTFEAQTSHLNIIPARKYTILHT